MTPAEGQNGNYLPAAVDCPDVQRAEHEQTHVERCHLCSMSFVKKVWVMADQGNVGGGLG